MTNLADLQAAYHKLLAGHAPVAFAGAASDAFELYTLALVLRAASEERGAIRFESAQEVANPSSLHFRTSPGSIYSDTKNYSHAVIEFPAGLSFEAHIGVYVEGLAGVVHECDVLVIDKSEGQFCRRNRVHPKKVSTVLTAECKLYAGTLGIALGRQFLGVTADLGSDGRFFLSNKGGRSVDRVLAHHKRQRFFGLTPRNQDAEQQVVAQFRSTFRNLKAKRS
jgi:hypothetical protein